MDIRIVENSTQLDCDVLIVNKFQDELTSNDLINRYAPDSFTGKVGEVFTIHTRKELPSKYVMAVGFGIENNIDRDVICKAITAAVKKCLDMKFKTIAFDIRTNVTFGIPTILTSSIVNYSFDKYKTKKNHKISTVYISNVSSDINVVASAVEGLELARDLANEPAEYATPERLAKIAQSFEGIETDIYNEKEIAQMGMNAYLAVAKGSDNPPRFIHMKYVPENPEKKIALIGKGLCFDSGGLDLKPASSMLTMRNDMAGAACVLGLMSVIDKIRPNVEVHALIAACENMPSGKSYKPGDIVTARNGKTIEVDNTDAEGRLTLADVLCYACDLEVDEVIDIATLTGACVVALGDTVSGIMGNNSSFVDAIIKTTSYSGEKFWELPMFQDYRDNMNSDVADMKNTGSRFGGASAAGMFLKEFVTDSVKCAHIDIAGTAFLDKPRNGYCKGATGVGYLTLLNYLLLHK